MKVVGQGRVARTAAADLRATKTSTDDETTRMYRIAYDESVRTLKDQADGLSNMRQRLVQFLAFVGTATAFLVGTGLRPSTGGAGTQLDHWFYPLSITGTALMGVTLLLTLTLLFPPFQRLAVTSDAGKIIKNHIDTDINPVDGEAHLLNNLAIYNDRAAKKNDKRLAWAKWFYFLAIFSGALQLGVWIVLVWVQVDPRQ